MDESDALPIPDKIIKNILWKYILHHFVSLLLIETKQQISIKLCTSIERKSGIFRFSKQRKGVFETSTSAIDRTRRVLSGTIIGRVGASDLTNREKKYFVFHFLAVFWTFSPFRGCSLNID